MGQANWELVPGLFLGQNHFMNIMINVKMLYSLKAHSLKKRSGKNELAKGYST